MTNETDYNVKADAESLMQHINNHSKVSFGRFRIEAHVAGRRWVSKTGRYTVYPMEYREVNGKQILCYGHKVNKSGWKAEQVAKFLAKNH